MRPVSSLSALALGMLSSWQMLLFWSCAYILIMSIQNKGRPYPALRNGLLLLLCLVDYTLFQFTIGYSTQTLSRRP